MRPTPIHSVLGLVRFSSAQTSFPSAETRHPSTPLAAPSVSSPHIGGQNLLLEPEPLYLHADNFELAAYNGLPLKAKCSPLRPLPNPSIFTSPYIGVQNLSPTPVPPCLQWVTPFLESSLRCWSRIPGCPSPGATQIAVAPSLANLVSRSAGNLPWASALRNPCTSCAVTRYNSPGCAIGIGATDRTWSVAQSSTTLLLQLLIRETL
jgi:hypothetical protein